MSIATSRWIDFVVCMTMILFAFGAIVMSSGCVQGDFVIYKTGESRYGLTTKELGRVQDVHRDNPDSGPWDFLESGVD